MDMEAEVALRKAFEIALPHNVRTIPKKAREILKDQANGAARIAQAIEDMVKNGELEASRWPWKDWRLL